MTYLYSICKICNKYLHRDFMMKHKDGRLKDRTCKICYKEKLKFLRNKYTLLMKTSFGIRRIDPRKKYQLLSKESCELCHFKGYFSQLDIDHIDQNHKNNDPTNLRTLCANCHRFITYKQRGSLL